MEILRSRIIDNEYVALPHSPLKFRIFSHIECEGTVPLMIVNYDWPVFVFPEVYMDVQHASHAEPIQIIDRQNNTANLFFNRLGFGRLSALAENHNLSILMYFNNYVVMDFNVTSEVSASDGPLEVYNLQDESVAKMFCEAINSAKT